MNERRADAFRASLDRDRIELQFGRAAASPASDSEARVELTDSIALAPATARRLLVRLRESLREISGRAVTAPGDAVAHMGKTPVNAPQDQAGERATLLFRLVDALGIGYCHERSFRLTQDTLLANRMLLSISTARLGSDAEARVLGICTRLGMPTGLNGAVVQQLAAARCVHFGFEAESERTLYKVYFERRDADAEAARAAAGEGVLLHLAWKWDPQEPARSVLTRYTWYPRLAIDAIRARLERIFGSDRGEPIGSTASILEQTAARIAAEKLQYLEVAEDTNERMSFDLNVYDAGMTVKDVQAPLAQLRDHFSIRPGRFQALYDRIRAQPLGHFAGGLHRDGKPFVTIYYGVERRG